MTICPSSHALQNSYYACNPLPLCGYVTYALGYYFTRLDKREVKKHHSVEGAVLLEADQPASSFIVPLTCGSCFVLYLFFATMRC